MTSVETEQTTADAKLEKINNPTEVPEESFKDATLDRVVSRSRELEPMPPLNFGEKLLEGSLAIGALGVTVGVGSIAWRIYEQSPLWLLLPAGFLALYLAGGYDDWRATLKK